MTSTSPRPPLSLLRSTRPQEDAVTVQIEVGGLPLTLKESLTLAIEQAARVLRQQDRDALTAALSAIRTAEEALERELMGPENGGGGPDDQEGGNPL